MTEPEEIPLVIERWRKEGEEIRSRLLQEREALVARLREVDRWLTGFPGEGPPLSATASLPDVVRAMFRQAGAGVVLSAGEALARVRILRESATAVNVNSVLYRLVRAGEVVAGGARGSMVYRWKGVEAS